MIVPRDISIESPFECVLKQIIKINHEKGFLTALLSDSENQDFMGFFYGDIINILQFPQVLRRFPLQLSVFKGEFKQISSQKWYLEVHHVILDNTIYINSNWIGSYDFCPMQAYLTIYINIDSEANEFLLWGNILHNFLSGIYSSKDLSQHLQSSSQLQTEFVSTFLKACHEYWVYFVILNRDINNYRKEFETNFLQNELAFYQQEYDHYTTKYGDYQWICEKSIYSHELGLQGRIDRYIHNIPFTKFCIYETKTGVSLHAAQSFAFYQALSYATMIRFFPPHPQVESIYIENPRLPLPSRLTAFSANEPDLLRVIKIRNEIWKILVGIPPIRDEWASCGRCGNKNACDFYQFRAQRDSSQSISRTNPFFSRFNLSQSDQQRFMIFDAYLTWFFGLLDAEYQFYFDMITQFHHPSPDQDPRNFPLSDIRITAKYSILGELLKDTDIDLVQSLLLRKETQINEIQMRFRTGDFIILTPRDIPPLTIESEYAIIIRLIDTDIVVQCTHPLPANHSFFQFSSYRIDNAPNQSSVLNQKRAVDSFIRIAASEIDSHIANLSRFLLFQVTPRQQIVGSKFLAFETTSIFNLTQQRAIQMSLQSKDLVLIQGPPGTGKTTLIVELIVRLVHQFCVNLESKKKKTEKRDSRVVELYGDQPRPYHPSKRPVLISTFTNKALDNIIRKLHAQNPDIRIVRIGNPISIDEDIQPLALEILCCEEYHYPSGEIGKIVNPLKARLILESVDVVAATTTMAGSLLLSPYRYETVILDEASQIIESSALNALLKGDRYILVGDHMQLPPISRELTSPIESLFSPDQLQKFEVIWKSLHFTDAFSISQSIFERLVKHYKDFSNYILLDEQYRMNRVISNFISHTFYENHLKPGVNQGVNVGDLTLETFFHAFHLDKFDYTKYSEWGQYFSPDKPMIFLDTKNLDLFEASDKNIAQLEFSKFNSGEVTIIIQLLRHFLSQIRLDKEDLVPISKILQQIGIISPYRAQNHQILTMINPIIQEIFPQIGGTLMDHLIIDTVDRFQGQERALIIYSFVDSNEEHKISVLTQELRRLNVAISRTKYKVILIGNSITLEQVHPTDSLVHQSVKKTLHELIAYIKQYNGYYELPIRELVK